MIFNFLRLTFVLFVLVSLHPSSLFSLEDESFGDVISRYFNTEDNENIPILELSYGPERMTFHSNFTSSFEENFASELQYGFLRFDKELSKDGLLYFSSERAFLGSSSSRFKLTEVAERTIKTDIYRYGGLYNNGFGYGTEKSSKLLFSHSSAIMWTESDVENFVGNENDNRLLREFKKQNNFGMFYASGIIYTFGASNTSLELKYTHNVVWTSFQFQEWFGSWMIENIIQRTPDLFHKQFLEIFGGYYPIIYQIYKTGVSYLLYEARSKNTYWPFKGSEVLTQRSIRLGIKFTL